MNRINLKNKFSLLSNKLNSKQKIIEMDSLENLYLDIPLWLQWLEPIIYAKKNTDILYEIKDFDIDEIDIEIFKHTLFVKLKNQLNKQKEKIKNKFIESSDGSLNVGLNTILMDSLLVETPSLPSDRFKELYEAVSADYSYEPNRRKRNELIRNNPYYQALQVKFAYAVTCHKSQGGQWDAVFVDQGYLTEEMINVEYLRWLYTAITRAKKELYLVNFTEVFYGGEKE